MFGTRIDRRGCVARHPIILILILAAIYGLIAPASHAVAAKNFLWKVRSGKGTAYILGSIHFMKPDAYPLHASIEGAFDASDVLAVEADVGAVTEANIQKLMESAFYQDGSTMENHVSRETYDFVRKELTPFGIPPELVNRQRPWFTAMTLQALELIRLGYDPSHGIDMHFLSKAQGRKKVSELESIDYQINVLSSLSEKEQEALLVDTIMELRQANKNIDNFVRAWKAGDVRAMEALVSGTMTGKNNLSSVYEKLLSERNRTMAGKIEGFLETGETHFIIVGAAHLIGKDGIISMLRSRGYAVEQL
jgi:uncharacterized protein YbaP (TraB family)